MRKVRLLAASMLAAVVLISTAVAAEPYPTKPIRVLDGFPPGGGTDYLARVVARKLTDGFGQPVIVDNRPGATGNLAAQIVARANPDGYTWLMGLTSVLAPSYTLYPRMGYNLLKDFAYVTLVASGTYVLSVHPSVPAKSVSELVAIAKAKPGGMRYGSSGVAGPLHLAMELLKGRTGIELLHVPYKGAAPVITALAAAEVQVGFTSVAAAMPLVKARRLNALAVTSAKRATVLPELPTIAESGFPGYDVTPWYGILVPAKTPAAIITLLNTEIGKVLRMSDVQASFASQALEATGSTPERFKAIMADEVKLWARVIKDAGVKAE